MNLRFWRISPHELTKPWPMFKQAVRDYQANWRQLALTTLIIALPVAIISNFGVDASSNSSAAAYLAFAQLAMNVAVIFMVTKIVTGKKVTLRQAYYDGSAMLVRLVLVSLLLVLALVPLLIGLVIMTAGVLSAGVFLRVPEQILLTVLAIVISLPSFVLVTRGLWALYVIFDSQLGPLQAWVRSRQLSRGKVLPLLGRGLALVVFVAGLLVVPVVALVLLQNLTHWGLWAIILQTLVTLTVLPLANLYLYRYYRELA